MAQLLILQGGRDQGHAFGALVDQALYVHADLAGVGTDLLRCGGRAGGLLHAAQQVCIGGQLFPAMPAMQLGQAVAHQRLLRIGELHVAVQPPVEQGGGVVVACPDGAAAGQQKHQQDTDNAG